MIFLRALLIWVLVLSLPIEAMAANSVSHCQDLQKSAAGQNLQGMSHHDHAAMMAAMSEDASVAGMHHQALPGASAQPSGKATLAGCQCGCDCGGNCALSCAGMMVSLAPTGLALEQRADATKTLLPRGQAHAAYSYEPLRPPSAVAL